MGGLHHSHSQRPLWHDGLLLLTVWPAHSVCFSTWLVSLLHLQPITVHIIQSPSAPSFGVYWPRLYRNLRETTEDHGLSSPSVATLMPSDRPCLQDDHPSVHHRYLYRIGCTRISVASRQGCRINYYPPQRDIDCTEEKLGSQAHSKIAI